MDERFYLLKVELLDVVPPIWRRFVVPASISLDRLHDVIQIVMGWNDSHLYAFTIGKKRYAEYLEFDDDALDCSAYRLDDLIKRKGRTFEYLYDFGDGWEHVLVLENSNYNNPLRLDLHCLEGERACPPDDVGGALGYHEFCKALKNPKHEDHERYVEWIWDDFDSECFDIDWVNLELMKYRHWSRDRYLFWEY